MDGKAQHKRYHYLFFIYYFYHILFDVMKKLQATCVKLPEIQLLIQYPEIIPLKYLSLSSIYYHIYLFLKGECGHCSQVIVGPLYRCLTCFDCMCSRCEIIHLDPYYYTADSGTFSILLKCDIIIIWLMNAILQHQIHLP